MNPVFLDSGSGHVVGSLFWRVHFRCLFPRSVRGYPFLSWWMLLILQPLCLRKKTHFSLPRNKELTTLNMRRIVLHSRFALTSSRHVLEV